MKQYNKLSIALRNYLLGARYHTAMKVFDYAQKIHNGFRKDGVTPEFQHQIEIALFITTLKDLQNEEAVISAALLHDVLEDYPEIRTSDIKKLAGKDVMTAVVLLSKEVQGQVRCSPEEYFNQIATNPIASIVKGCDRIHNLRTMVGVFTKEKQLRYVKEAQQFFLPMLKEAFGLFPIQHLAYVNIRTTLKIQIELITSIYYAVGLEIE
jgi:(p)ppGpp synthase/HD superfamily hydrolase